MTATITCKRCGKAKALKSYYPSNKSTCIACILKSGIAYRKAHKGMQQGGVKARQCRDLKRIPAPCGRDMVPARAGRCAELLTCAHYVDCLIEATKENWQGWKCVAREVVNAGETVVDAHGSNLSGGNSGSG